MSEKKKRVNKTEDELVAQQKQVEKVKMMRKFVKEQFYPALINASESIEDAKFLLQSFSSMVMEQFLVKMKDTQFIDLQMHTKLDKTSPKYKEFVDLLTLFGDKSVFESRDLIEGMKAEIEMMVMNEMKDRKLDSLKTNWFEE
jgi:hypothetical protein